MFSFRYPAVVIFIAVLIGTLAGRYLQLPLYLHIILIITSVLGLLISLWRHSVKTITICLSLVFLLIAGYSSERTFHHSDKNSIQLIINSQSVNARLFGRIHSWPVLKEHKTQILCALDSVVIADSVKVVSGIVLITVTRVTTGFVLGDNISVAGILHPVKPKGIPVAFDYSQWLSNKGVQARIQVRDPANVLIDKQAGGMFGVFIDTFRNWILDVFNRFLDPIPSAMASGYLIGETRHIPEEIYLAFRTTGTMHLLAVSGSNVALILLVALVILRPFPLNKYVRLSLLLVLIFVFSHLSYNQPSVVRASVMAILVLIGRIAYRRIDLQNLIAAAAVILLLYDPTNLYDVGFQLSFAVTWGLILFLPLFHNLLLSRPLHPGIRYGALVLFCSVIASAISIPITLYYFGELSLITVFSNLLVVPLVSVSVVGITALLFLAALFPPLAFYPGKVLSILLTGTNHLVLWFNTWDFAVISHVSLPAWGAVSLLAATVLLFAAIGSRLARRIFLLFSALIIIVLLVRDVYFLPDGPDEMLVVNAGSAEAVIVYSQEGLVIYKQVRDGLYDYFTDGLFPHLFKESSVIPHYVYFFDDDYLIHQRINALVEDYRSVLIRPLQYNEDGISYKLWHLTTDNSVGFVKDSSCLPVIGFSSTAVFCQFDSFSVTYLSEVTLENLTLIRNHFSTGWIVVSLDRRADFQKLGELPGKAHVAVLCRFRRGDDNAMIDNKLLCDLRGCFASFEIVLIDESLRIRLE